MSRYLPRLQADWHNLVLVGMPGAGKSTLGVLLAKELALGFVDTDLLIQTDVGKTLQQIVDTGGYLVLRDHESRVLANLELSNSVIATGGSAVYSEFAMTALSERGVIVYLDVSLPALRSRITNYDQRGIARRPEQSFEDLYEERKALYLRWADKVIDCDGKTPEEVIAEVLMAVAG